jgi:pimeloyl-ACP methyl ester carboxylesterase
VGWESGRRESTSRINKQLQLPDGRLLGYDEHGPLDGTPIFYFHGSPSARVEWYLFGSEAIAEKLNIRVIAPDRPGLGRSDFQPGRRIGFWPTDVLALADHLGLDRFAVVGYSGGGPYAAACALKIPERLTHVGVVSGTGPFDKPGLSTGINPTSLRFMELACSKPWLSRLVLRMMGLMAHYSPRRVIDQAMAALPVPDQATLARPDVQRRFIAMIREALRAGPRGAQWDTALMVSPWDFRPQDIRMTVRLWHGEADANAPLAMGRYMVATIPKSQVSYYPGEGHLSLMAKYSKEVLSALAM